MTDDPNRPQSQLAPKSAATPDPRPPGAARASGRARDHRALLAAAVLLIASCATVPTDYPRTESTAFQLHETTRIGKELAGLAAQHPGESGVAIIRQGRTAFTARVVLADFAEKTLDVQYFLWERDATGLILGDHLVRAADRGVRVRP